MARWDQASPGPWLCDDENVTCDGLQQVWIYPRGLEGWPTCDGLYPLADVDTGSPVQMIVKQRPVGRNPWSTDPGRDRR